ncbi:hypothetical protein BDW74DRAFT_152855 [Aspergillus multicolor]|uniref:OSTA/TMEM184 family protein n=1 Tax=Aspergillus multicolor TaxID=41759 RepID=UPI003CCD78D2
MAIFRDSDGREHTCPIGPSFYAKAPKDFIGPLSFQHFNMILSGACTGLVCIIIFLLTAQHAMHLSKPKEQIKIIKISLLLPLYTITSFLAICLPRASVYISPWMEVYQAIALVTFFLLLCEYVSADGNGLGAGKSMVGGEEWFRKKSTAIFQYLIVAIGVAIATDITQAVGVYCLESNNAHFAHIWLTVIAIISLVFAVIAILAFYQVVKRQIARHTALAKLLAIKLIVGLAFIERIIFSILRSTSALKPSSILSNAYTQIGIPHLLICVQMVPFALFFTYAYSVAPYVRVTREGYESAARAWVGMLDPREILSAAASALFGGSRVAIPVAERMDAPSHGYRDGYAYGGAVSRAV